MVAGELCYLACSSGDLACGTHSCRLRSLSLVLETRLGVCFGELGEPL